MSIFTSQFDHARGYSGAYAGSTGDPTWRTPAAVAAAAGGAVVAAAVAAEALAAEALAAGALAGADPEPPEAAGGDGWGEGWGDGWDQGWDAGGFPDGVPEVADDGGAAWMDRGDYTDAGVGGDEDFFYFIDGDSSLTVG
jgi:hypothetical protein